MSLYLVKGKGWRYDFTQNGIRHTGTWFKTKKEAAKSEAIRKEELQKPQQTPVQTDMDFLELVNRRLDYVKAYASLRHYTDYSYLARRWIRHWGHLKSHQISTDMIQSYLIDRSKSSPHPANKDLRYLKSTFNFGLKRGWIKCNPTQQMSFMPVDKKVNYVPPTEDVAKILLAADPDTMDYLYTIKETLARVSEVNNLMWADVNLRERYLVLYTRKKKGGHRTPRKVPMTNRLYEILTRRFNNSDKAVSWVFWHKYWARKNSTWVTGPYKDRKRIMLSLCKKAGVKYFRFHALRHYGASILDSANVGIGSIQRILGHENRSTTEIYLHSIGESERDAMRIFEQVEDSFQKKSHTDSHTKAQ